MEKKFKKDSVHFLHWKLYIPFSLKRFIQDSVILFYKETTKPCLL